MPGGACIHHGGRLGSHDWIVPRFEPTDELSADDTPAPGLPDDGVENVLEYTFGLWGLVPISDHVIVNEIRDAVNKFCLHEDDEDSD